MSWERCPKLSPHAFHSSDNAERLAVSPEKIASLLNSLGRYLNNRMELASARAVLERALAIDEKTLGPEHTSVAGDVNNLGSVLKDQGDLEGARKCYQRARAILEKRLGKDHLNTIQVRNNLQSLQKLISTPGPPKPACAFGQPGGAPAPYRPLRFRPFDRKIFLSLRL